MALMIPRISNHSVFSMCPFDSLSPFAASSAVISVVAHFSSTTSERNDCKFCVALQHDLTTTKQNNECCHSLNCPRFFDSFFQHNTAHDVLMSVFFHRDASY